MGLFRKSNKVTKLIIMEKREIYRYEFDNPYNKDGSKAPNEFQNNY